MINQSMKEHQIYVNDYAGKEGIIQYQFYFVSAFKRSST